MRHCASMAADDATHDEVRLARAASIVRDQSTEPCAASIAWSHDAPVVLSSAVV